MLVSQLLKENIIDVINDELKVKLGHQLSEEMSAKISWCAMVVCWAYQVQNAFKKLEFEFKSLENEKMNYF